MCILVYETKMACLISNRDEENMNISDNRRNKFRRLDVGKFSIFIKLLEVNLTKIHNLIVIEKKVSWVWKSKIFKSQDIK